ncbi:hypothetical protein DAPPUDRAFT_106354 [Daphnia pulex]|uniref:Uncharacterized protein n=1 Tax=Daphnia pulex TaxID=6669 RepID=E9GTM0_DAPPU|nr:hypothetical protein DAPPUDRAFT_106354 [Daphnia pulex]|eukprot:EFX77103.1 hypothetical protein DAPPUDRAFT_106354 [Daphnia pulex]
MSPLVSSRLMVILAVCVVGLWCHPMPEKDNNTNDGALNPLLKKMNDLGQLNDFADSDYHDTVTDFLRLSTTSPTVATSTKKSVVTTPSTLSPSTTIKTTIAQTTTDKSPSSSGVTKAFEVATAKFFPSVAPTIVMTTGKPTTAAPPVAEALAPKLETLAPVVATPLPFVEKLQKTNKPAPLNEIEPLTKPTFVAQTTAMPPISNVSQKKLIPDLATLTQQSPAIPTARPAVSGSIKQQAVPAVQRQPVAVLNQPQQQQMAVSGAASIQQQPTNLVQTAASSTATAPRQQQPNFAPMAVPISTQQQQQPVMQNPARMQPPMMPTMLNAAQSATQQQMMMQNPAVMQQMMMRNPVFQQQQFQQMLQNRPQFSTRVSTSTAKPGVQKTAAPAVMTLISNPLFGSNGRPVFFLGGNGTPTKMFPISSLPQLLSPPVANTASPV